MGLRGRGATELQMRGGRTIHLHMRHSHSLHWMRCGYMRRLVRRGGRCTGGRSLGRRSLLFLLSVAGERYCRQPRDQTGHEGQPSWTLCHVNPPLPPEFLPRNQRAPRVKPARDHADVIAMTILVWNLCVAKARGKPASNDAGVGLNCRAGERSIRPSARNPPANPP